MRTFLLFGILVIAVIIADDVRKIRCIAAQETSCVSPFTSKPL